MDDILGWIPGGVIRRFWIEWWWIVTLGLLWAAAIYNGLATRIHRGFERNRVRRELEAAYKGGRSTEHIQPVADLRESERDDRGRYMVFLLAVITLLLAGILAELIRN